MNFSQYSPNSEMWKKHFTGSAQKVDRKKGLCLVKNSVSGSTPSVELITPTAAVIQRAKASLKRKGSTNKSSPNRQKKQKSKAHQKVKKSKSSKKSK